VDAAPHTVAQIDEAACIGCTLCIAACPVDAIVGAARRMHGVLRSLCTGCGLCAPPCPVDCIAFVPSGRPWTAADDEAAGERESIRRTRLARNERLSARVVPIVAGDAAVLARQARVAAALARARARRARAAAR
jgi:electron transport complex protein RnfB